MIYEELSKENNYESSQRIYFHVYIDDIFDISVLINMS